MKAKSEEVIDPKTLIKKTLSRKELKKVVESWIDETKKKKKKNKMVDERKLELMLILCYDYKSLVRCNSCLQFKFKSLLMTQEDEDPPFVGLVVLPGAEKVKDNDSYPSCTIRDVDLELCSQFMFAFLVLFKLNTCSATMSFLCPEKTPDGQIH